jgi:FAD/FMN-containing dehydrogenase
MFLGYSYKSSQYGLTVDNVAGYEMVLPNGAVINVTSKDDDLWFGLRVSSQDQYILVTEGLELQGGMNNFVSYQFVARAKFMGC